MENISAISSEEELLQLRNEGKISETEYNDLLDALKRPPSSEIDIPGAESHQVSSKTKLGKIAFVLMLIGIVFPAVCFLILELLSGPYRDAPIAPLFFLGVAIEIGAFVVGIISWPNVFGKAAVITSSVLAVFVMILFVLTM
jgi:hypothetical protein